MDIEEITASMAWAGPTIETITAAISPQAGFTATDVEEAERLVMACMLAALEPHAGPDEVKVLLGSLTKGYGRWLGFVEDAILRAEIDEDDVDRQAVHGAFRMACAFIFELEGRRDLSPAPDAAARRFTAAIDLDPDQADALTRAAAWWGRSEGEFLTLCLQSGIAHAQQHMADQQAGGAGEDKGP